MAVVFILQYRHLSLTPGPGAAAADQCGNICVQPRYRDVLEYADTTKQLTKQVQQWTDWTLDIHTYKGLVNMHKL